MNGLHQLPLGLALNGICALKFIYLIANSASSSSGFPLTFQVALHF
jgi:hypothetical protein